jgi:hypothetical protein
MASEIDLLIRQTARPMAFTLANSRFDWQMIQNQSEVDLDWTGM